MALARWGLHHVSMKLLANLGLLLLLVLAMGAVATAAVWTWRPDLVEAVDARWTSAHTDGVRQRLAALRALSATDRDEAVRGLERLTGELRSYRKADRRFPVRCQALKLLADLHFDGDDLDAARRPEERSCSSRTRTTSAPGSGSAAGSARRRAPDSGGSRSSRSCSPGSPSWARSPVSITTARVTQVRTRWPRTSSSATWSARCGPSSPSRGVTAPGRSGGVRTASGPRSAGSTWRPCATDVIGRRLRVPRGGPLPAARPSRGQPPGLRDAPPRRPGGRPADRDPHPGGWPSEERPHRRGLPPRPGQPDPWMIVPLPEAHRDRPIRGRFVVQADRLPSGSAKRPPALPRAPRSQPARGLPRSPPR